MAIPGIRIPHAGLVFELHHRPDEPELVYVVHKDRDGTQTYVDVPTQGDMNQVLYHRLYLLPAMQTVTEQVKLRKKRLAKTFAHAASATVN
jgi:hypothetical protein